MSGKKQEDREEKAERSWQRTDASNRAQSLH